MHRGLARTMATSWLTAPRGRRCIADRLRPRYSVSSSDRWGCGRSCVAESRGSGNIGQDRHCLGSLESAVARWGRLPEFGGEISAPDVNRWELWWVDPKTPVRCECGCGCREPALLQDMARERAHLRCPTCVAAGHPPDRVFTVAEHGFPFRTTISRLARLVRPSGEEIELAPGTLINHYEHRFGHRVVVASGPFSGIDGLIGDWWAFLPPG